MPNSIEFHRIPAMAAGNHKLSMDEYKQLSELLRRAELDGRLGEAMVFSGLAEKVAPALTRYQQNLTGIPGGNNGPFTLNLQSMVGSGSDGPPSGLTPAAKSVTQKGKAAVATMTAPSSSSSGAAGLTSWSVNGRGELVNGFGELVQTSEQDVMHGSMHEQSQQLPMAPQETSDQGGLRWKSKWTDRGTASAIGYPPPSKPMNSQSNAAPSNLVPTEAASWNLPMPSTQQVVTPASVAASASVVAPDAMEVGRVKRGWESTDGSMHDGEFANWSLVHEEVLQQLSDNDLVGPAYQEGAEPVDPHCWWPSINYGCVDAAIPVPAKANGSVEQWGLTAADKLPRLKEMGLQGRSYESLVRQALSGDRVLAGYLSWIRSYFMQKYCVQGPTSQGLDLAGFLAKVRFEAPVDSDGFARRFVTRR